MKVVSIVEGDGEVAALPVLLRRLCEWRTPQSAVEVLRPIRVRRNKFLNDPREFGRHLELAAGKCGPAGWILVMLDADDDCPKEYAPDIFGRARAIVGHRSLSVVLANREYEGWFIAAADSLHGHRGFSCELPVNFDPETVRDAKGWIGARMAEGSYGETTDQPAFSARMDLKSAHDRSRSFRKLCREWESHVASPTPLGY